MNIFFTIFCLYIYKSQIKKYNDVACWFTFKKSNLEEKKEYNAWKNLSIKQLIFFYRIKNLLIIFFLNPNFFHDKICYIYLKIQWEIYYAISILSYQCQAQ